MDFDPKKFIDREFEQELFAKLLQFKDSSRILTIQAAGGMGKSHLLEKFQYRCRTARPRRIPVSLINLDQLSDSSPLRMLNLIMRDLSGFGIRFPNFIRYETARASADFTSIRSSIYLQNSSFQGASDVRISSIMANIDNATTVQVNTGFIELTYEQQIIAQDVCIQAFFADLKDYCMIHPVVLLLDTYDKCDKKLQDWLKAYMLQSYFFDIEHRPKYLLLIISGRTIPEFEMIWPEEDCGMIVKSINELRKWTKAHVEECLRIHGFNYETQDLDTFYRLIDIGLPPSTVVDVIQTALLYSKGQK